VIVAVLGAGNVGCALAGDLALRGFDVRLFTRSPERRAELRAAAGITLTGAIEGRAEVAVTDSVAAAVIGADVVALAVPTPALVWYARPLIETTDDRQLIWCNPGHSGGALYLAAEFRRRAPARRPWLAQLTTASHGSRLSGPATVSLFGLPRVGLAAFPARRLGDCAERLGPLLPGGFVGLGSVIEADLLNINAVLHPPGMVANAGWIEATGGDFAFYHQGISRAVARVVDAVEAERVGLARALGVPTVPILEDLERAGYTEPGSADGPGLYEAVRGSAAVRAIKAPPSLDHRYLHEDVGWGLVPWMALAEATGVPTPAMAAVTALGGFLTATDYRAAGADLERLGLAGMTPAEIHVYVESGTAPA
jgi:opine dehydrogenase